MLAEIGDDRCRFTDAVGSKPSPDRRRSPEPAAIKPLSCILGAARDVGWSELAYRRQLRRLVKVIGPEAWVQGGEDRMSERTPWPRSSRPWTPKLTGSARWLRIVPPGANEPAWPQGSVQQLRRSGVAQGLPDVGLYPTAVGYSQFGAARL